MNIAVVTGGGSGLRMGAPIPKQFIEVDGKYILTYTILNCEHCEDIDKIIVVCHKDYMDMVWDQIKKFNIKKVVDIVQGGKSNAESIHNAYEVALKLSDNPEDIFMVTNGVNPLCSSHMYTKSIHAAQKYGIASAFYYIKDGIVEGDFKGEFDDDGKEIFTSSNIACKNGRDNLAIDGPPHSVKMGILEGMYKEAEEKGVECISIGFLALTLGRPIHNIENPASNFKITFPEDLVMFRAMVEYNKTNKNFSIKTDLY